MNRRRHTNTCLLHTFIFITPGLRKITFVDRMSAIAGKAALKKAVEASIFFPHIHKHSENPLKLVKSLMEIFSFFIGKNKKVFAPFINAIKDKSASRSHSRESGSHTRVSRSHTSGSGSHTRKNSSQSGGGGWFWKKDEDLEWAQEEMERLNAEINSDLRNILNPEKKATVVQLRNFIKKKSEYRHFLNFVYGLSIPFLAPQFAKILLNTIVHLISFSIAGVPTMAGAGAWNVAIYYLSHLFQPVNNMFETLKRIHDAQVGESDAQQDRSTCPPGQRPDPTLGCVPGIFSVEEPLYQNSSSYYDVTTVGKGVITNVSNTLKETLTNPLLGIVTLIVGGYMCYRLHITIIEEDRCFKEDLEKMKGKIYEQMRSVREGRQRTIADQVQAATALATAGATPGQLQQLFQALNPGGVPPLLGNAPRASGTVRGRAGSRPPVRLRLTQ